MIFLYWCRGLGAPMLRCQMVEVSDVSEAFPKGMTCHDYMYNKLTLAIFFYFSCLMSSIADGEIERNTLLPKSNFRAEEELKLEK